jgi:hypothetical protein
MTQYSILFVLGFSQNTNHHIYHSQNAFQQQQQQQQHSIKQAVTERGNINSYTKRLIKRTEHRHKNTINNKLTIIHTRSSSTIFLHNETIPTRTIGYSFAP